MAMAHAAQLLVGHGDVVLFAWIFAEQAGLPIPTVPVLLAAGSLASTGRMNFACSLILALAACLIADGFWYQMGRWYDAKVLRLLCRILMESDSSIRHIRTAFRRHGAIALLPAKFVPGVNFAMPPLAGTSGVSPLRFLLFDGVASVLWAGSYMVLGYIFTRQFERATTYSSELCTIGFAVLVAAIVALVGFRLLRNHQRLIPLQAREGSPAEHMETKAQKARAIRA